MTMGHSTTGVRVLVCLGLVGFVAVAHSMFGSRGTLTAPAGNAVRGGSTIGGQMPQPPLYITPIQKPRDVRTPPVLADPQMPQPPRQPEQPDQPIKAADDPFTPKGTVPDVPVIVAPPPSQEPPQQPPAATPATVAVKAPTHVALDVFGIPEAVVGPEEPEVFLPDPNYTTGYEDNWVTFQAIQQLVAQADPRLMVYEQPFRDAKHQAEWDKHVAAAERVMPPWGNPTDQGDTGDLFVYYPYFNVNRCPVETPECLAYLMPDLMADGQPKLKAYRKCCVEHRRIRDIVKIAMPLLTQTKVPYFLSFHSFVGLLRDGGVLPLGDTFATIQCRPQDVDQIEMIVGLDDAHRPPWLARGFEPFPDHVEMRAVMGPRLHYHKKDVAVRLHKLKGPVYEQLKKPRPKCLWYDFEVPVPADGSNTLMETNVWEQHSPHAPNLKFMFGLHWCATGCCQGSDLTVGGTLSPSPRIGPNAQPLQKPYRIQ